MKTFFKLYLIILCLITSTTEARLTEQQKSECMKLLSIAETKNADWIYDECGFNEEDVVWYDWAPIASQNKYAKALYQICKRYPHHEYSNLYCKKAVDAGSIDALYILAQRAKDEGNDELYEKNLLEIITRNPLQNKPDFSGVDNTTTRQAYEDLAKFYYKLQDEVKTQNVVPYLQIAAENGSTTAASTLAIFLYQSPNQNDHAMYEKYLWQAIMNGCPAAEKTFGLINNAQETVDQQKQKLLMNKLLFTCDPSSSSNKSKTDIEKAKNCACNEVLVWNKTQEDKPFLILELSSNSALLQAKDGTQYSVESGEKLEGGYVVEEIRPTAVILRKLAQRTVLLYRKDADCVQACKNTQAQTTNGITPYKLTFTDEECNKIADNIENLNNPLAPFRGVRECQLQDWKRWGNKALEGQKDKHLFLMANYEKSNYIPAYIARAKLMFAQGEKQAYPKIKQTLQEALIKTPNDYLAQKQLENAFCLQATLYLNGTENEMQEGFNLAEKGAQKGYPQSMNILGVAYANGWGTEQDMSKAEEWFLSADKASQTPFTDARYNYNLIKTNDDLDKMVYGNCEQILNPVRPSKEELLKLYQ